MKLEGQVAVVTGAGRGIGRAYALRLAGLGADVVINDIDLESAREFNEELTAPTVMDEVKNLGVRCQGIQADVRDKNAVDAMFQQVLNEFGRVDILVNNAGGMAGDRTRSFAASMPEEDIRATFDRNLMGTIFCSQAAAIPMKQQRYGRIITVSSQAGMRGSPRGFYASYSAAKAAIINFTQNLAQELGPYGINVNCIAPAYIKTGRMIAWNRWDLEERQQSMSRDIPLGRLGEPEDCAKVLEFFVTDLSDYVTGQCLSVCGGAIRFK